MNKYSKTPLYIFNENEFRNEINQIDWKTLLENNDMNSCFEKFLHILNYIFDDHVPIMKLWKKEKPHLSLTNHGLIITYDI